MTNEEFYEKMRELFKQQIVSADMIFKVLGGTGAKLGNPSSQSENENTTESGKVQENQANTMSHDLLSLPDQDNPNNNGNENENPSGSAPSPFNMNLTPK